MNQKLRQTSAAYRLFTDKRSIQQESLCGSLKNEMVDKVYDTFPEI